MLPYKKPEHTPKFFGEWDIFVKDESPVKLEVAQAVFNLIEQVSNARSNR